MKLLLDQNLSPRIARILSHEFPGSRHVQEAGLHLIVELAGF